MLASTAQPPWLVALEYAQESSVAVGWAQSHVWRAANPLGPGRRIPLERRSRKRCRAKHGQRDTHRPQAGARAPDRRVHEAVRVTVLMIMVRTEHFVTRRRVGHRLTVAWLT